MMRRLIVFVMFLSATLGWGQVQPAARGGHIDNGLFATYTTSRPNYGDDWIYGGSVGGFLQWSRYIGVDGRLTAQRWGNSPFHQYYGTIGPRVNFHVSRFSIYGIGEGGVGHAWAPEGHGYAGMWTVGAGADYRVNSRFKIRVGEFDYSKIYILRHGLNPKTLSAGFVVRVF